MRKLSVCAMARDMRLMQSQLNSRFSARAKDDALDLYIYDAIGSGFFGGIGPKEVADALASSKAKALNVYINSPGGDVFDGVAIYNMLSRFEGPVNVVIDGLAASIASIIMLAGDTITAHHNAMLMIHDPWGVSVGDARDMRSAADTLDKVRDTLIETYTKHTKQSSDVISKMMQDETWFDAKEALAKGFITAITGSESDAKASADFPVLAKYQKTPEALRKNASSADVMLATMEYRIGKRNAASR